MMRKCLFPVAGHGTRFLPATKSIPKEMLPIINKPLAQYGVEEALIAGMDQIAFVTRRGKQAIEDYFDNNQEVEGWVSGTNKGQSMLELDALIEQCEFVSTRQHHMNGLGDAILCGEPLIGDQPFGVILVDDLCVHEPDGVMSQMLEIYQQYRCTVIAVQQVPPEQVNQYGIVAGVQMAERLYQVSDMIEKPDPSSAPSNSAVIGRYILTPDIFEILRQTSPGKNGELQITDALKTQAAQGRVIAYGFRGRRFDCGSVNGFVEATNYFFERSIA